MRRKKLLIFLSIIYLTIQSFGAAAQDLGKLERAETIAGLGSWEMKLAEDRVIHSQGAQQILGISQEEFTTADSYKLLLPEYRKMRQEALKKLIEEGVPYDLQFQIQRPSDGAVIDIHSIAVYDPLTHSIFGTLHDITDYKTMERELISEKHRTTRTLLGFVLIQSGVMVVLVINTAQKRRVQRSMERNLQRNKSLVNILHHKIESVEELLEYALTESLKLTGSDSGCIYLYDETAQTFTLNVCSQEQAELCGMKTFLDRTIWDKAIQAREPIIVNRCPKGQGDLSRYMIVPTFDCDKIAALIGLGSKNTDYDSMDVWQITLLMNSVWTMVERKRSEIALRKEKERLQAILFSVDDGVITTDKNGNVEMMNQAAQTLAGWSEKEAIGQPWDQVFNLEKQDGSNHPVLLSRDGHKRYIVDRAAPIKNENGEINGTVRVFRDVTHEKLRRERIEYLSYYDPLTGLHNRRYFLESIARIDKPKYYPLSIMMGDVNGLKIVNEKFGHLTGDRLLRRAADVLRRNSRRDDIVSRWEGDKFVLLLPNTNQESAADLASRLEKELENEKIESISLSVSLGWAVKTQSVEDINEILKMAEKRMYRAKMLHTPGIRDETVQTLMTALYEKNKREERHSQRVSEFCGLLGQELDLGEREIMDLKITGLFHDIGKISIDDNILNKPGRLTEEEWQEIKRHPEVGYRVLRSVPGMEDIAFYILSHHERWDGGGYPQGLQGEEIPLQSRIVAVADAYDAMVSQRPYKNRLSKEAAAAELKRNAGTQFDPQIVDAFVKAVDSWDQVKA